MDGVGVAAFCVSFEAEYALRRQTLRDVLDEYQQVVHCV